MGYTPPAPDGCRNGHRFGPNAVVVGFRHCQCAGASAGGGHLTYRCRTCDDQIIWGCEDEGLLADYRPGPTS